MSRYYTCERTGQLKKAAPKTDCKCCGAISRRCSCSPLWRWCEDCGQAVTLLQAVKGAERRWVSVEGHINLADNPAAIWNAQQHRVHYPVCPAKGGIEPEWSRCRDCGDQITWVKSLRGKNVPIQGHVPKSQHSGFYRPTLQDCHWDRCEKRRGSF